MKKFIQNRTSCLISLLFLSAPLFAVGSYELPSGEWRQVSLPVNPGGSNTVNAIFADDIAVVDEAAVYGKDWVVYAYDPTAGGYERKELSHALRQGVGYWITQLTGSPAHLKMPEDSIAGPDPFSVDLIPPAEGDSFQWNMVGHPFYESMNFRDYKIKTSSGTCSGQGCTPTKAMQNDIFHNEIWRYKEGGYKKVSGDTPLNPWDGFWCTALAESTDLSPQIFLALPRPPTSGDWNLTFQEEFYGSSLNPAKWRIGGDYLGIVGNAANSAKQIAVQDGSLKLTAKKTPLTFAGKSYDHTTGEISTFQQFKQLYGYFEARIKYDVVQGVWPSFWTMPDNGDYGIDREGVDTEDLTHESFMRFDLSTFSQPVASALLKIKVIAIEFDPYNEANDLLNVTVHKLLSNDWDEQAITWNNKPAYDPIWLHQFQLKRPATVSQETSVFSENENNQEQLEPGKDELYSLDASLQAGGVSSAENSGEITIGQELVVDVTGYINSQITGNKNTAGFALVDTFMRIHKVSFGSREVNNLADRPQLAIDGNILYPVADAYVREGNDTNTNTNYANMNFGSNTHLVVQDPWGNAASTVNEVGDGMEIDIMESLGVWGANKTQHAVHWNGYEEPEHEHDHSEQVDIPPTTDDYHTYGMNWQPGQIDFYIDGIKSDWEFKNARAGSVDSFILLSHQLGGWRDSGNIIDDGRLPVTMSVDHVRVWAGSSAP